VANELQVRIVSQVKYDQHKEHPPYNKDHVVNSLRHVRSVQVYVVMSIAGFHVQIIQVLEIKNHHVAHVKKDWQADRKQSYCHHTGSSIIFTPFKLVLDTSDREQTYLSRQEYLQK
jgi:hypothetical protein